VTVTVYVPTLLELMVRVEEPDPPGLKLTLAGLMEAVRPVGVMDMEKLIMPGKLTKMMYDTYEVTEVSA